jgi:hypothetical protein
MTEGNPKPIQPSEGNTGPAPEVPLREVYKLPSQAILEGIWQGQIRNPEALRGYFLRQRTEYLQAHPDRESELDGPGEIGRWNRLVHSDTVDEYTGLAAFADSEVHRRTAGLAGSQLDSPAHLQGVGNLRQMAQSWRQRAASLTEPEQEHRPLPRPIEPTSAVSELTPERQPRTSRPDYDRMLDYEVLDGINNGSLTETEAVHVYIEKSLNSVRELYEGEDLQEKETEYAEVIYGDPQDMIRFCLGRATEHLGSGAAPEAVSPANYKIAARWYTMAGRFAQEAAQSRRDEDTETEDTETKEER